MATQTRSNECVLCHEQVTWAEWWSLDCPESDALYGLGHVLTEKGGPGLICPECGEQKPEDDRVAANMKCAECSYGG